MILAILVLSGTSTLFSGLALFLSLVNRGWIIQTFSLVYRNMMENWNNLLSETEEESE